MTWYVFFDRDHAWRWNAMLIGDRVLGGVSSHGSFCATHRAVLRQRHDVTASVRSGFIDRVRGPEEDRIRSLLLGGSYADAIMYRVRFEPTLILIQRN